MQGKSIITNSVKIVLCILLLMVLVQGVQAEAYQFVTKWGSQGTGDGQFSYPHGVAVDSSGNVYVSDQGNHRIQKFTSTGTFWTKWGPSNTPQGIAVDSSGNVYVAYSDCIQKFSSDGTFLMKWGTMGSGDGQFMSPAGVTIDSSGNVYVADTYNNRIQKFSSTGTFLLNWGTLGSGDGSFSHPYAVAVDSSGNVYVADTFNRRIQKFNATGSFLATWGTQGSNDGQFQSPEGVAVDSSGNVFVTDGSRIERFSSNGTFLMKWGSAGSGDGQFSNAFGVAVDSSGNVYIVEEIGNRIQKFALVYTPVVDFTASVTSGTAPLTVTFTDNSMNYPTSWSWSFGDGSSVNATQQNPVHTYTSAGTYTVALTATNVYGLNTKTTSNYITVTAPPVANFTGTPTTGTAPLTVQFTDSSTNTPTSWSWLFGDGSSSTLQNPSHTYSSTGTYTISLNATNSAGSNALTRTNYITVSPAVIPPVASFTGTPTSGTAPLTVQFTDSSTNMVPYSSAQTQQETGSGFITKTIPTQVTSAAHNSVPETFVPIAGATGDDLHSAPLNPDYIRFVKEKSYDSQVQVDTHGLGLVPSPIYRPEVKDVQMFRSSTGDRSSSYSSTFDLRTSGKVSPVKDQGNFGTCWAFATFASLESTLMPTTPTPDFSEKNLANLAGFDYSIPDGGGQMWMSTAYLTRWNGPVNSATDPYPTGTWTTSSTYPPVKHVQNVVFIPARTSRTDTGTIKEALTQWGAVSSALYWSDSFYNNISKSYYQPASASDTGGGGHAVTIIGWDDGYAASNFNTAPAGPGAWLVKNSWGTTWGNAGYFYVSYYDKYFGSAIPPAGYYKDTAVFRSDSTSNYDTVYSYDKLGDVNDYSYGSTKTGSFANVFTATSSGTIKAVGFYTTDVNVPFTISIYKNPTSGPVGGTPAATFSGTLPYMGYNTVIIPSSQQVPVTTGDKFSIVVQVTNPTNNYYIPIEENIAGYTSGIISHFGQGYLHRSSGWTDIKTILDNSHVCVKAYTGSTTPSPASWSWSFGDGSSSTLQNPYHAYSSAGTYTVTLTATNSAGSNTLTRTNYITVSSGGVTPVANFVGTPTSGTAPLTVTFSDSSTGSPTSWIWDFGDGSTSTSQNPSHVYSSTGTYTVALTATNSAGSNKFTRTNYITVSSGGVAPVANFVGTPTSGTAPLTVQFTDSSTNMLTHSSAQTQQETKSGLITKKFPAGDISSTQNTRPEKVVTIAGGTSDELQGTSSNPEFVRNVKEKQYNAQMQYQKKLNNAVNNPSLSDTVYTSSSETYNFVTKWGIEGEGNGQFDYPEGIAVDSSGNVYITDTGNDRIQKFSSNGIFLAKWGSDGLGDGQFYYPYGVAVDSSGNVYVADSSNDRIQKFSSNGVFLAKWGSYGSSDGQFFNPKGVAVDSSGNVYIADTWNDRIQKFSSNGVFLAKWGSDGSGDGQFNSPNGVAVDSSGNVYVADTANGRIQKFSSNGVFLAKWGSMGDGRLYWPIGIAVDSSDSVYITDQIGDPIQKFGPTGSFSTKWGTEGSGDGQFSDPDGVAVDSSGNVFVADSFNHRIQKFVPSSASSTSGSWNFGDGSSSTLQNPVHIYTSAGTYTVALTATNSTGSNTLTRTNSKMSHYQSYASFIAQFNSYN